MSRGIAVGKRLLLRHTALAARIPAAIMLLAVIVGCPGATPDGSLLITNAAPGVLVTELYLVPTGSTHWGSNLMPLPIAYGQSFLLTGVEPGNYDEKAVAIYLDTNETDQLVNEAIHIQAGQTFTHLVHFAPQWP